MPPYFSQAVITPDHREATLAFGIRLMPLSRQQRVIDYMRAQLHPPAGVSAELAGLPVLAAQADASLSSSGRRMLMLLAGLVAVGLVLLAVLRTVRRALVPLVPIALATGWSSLILFATRIPLNPMSATLGALVIAISTEFSVLLSERFRAERRAGLSPAEALARTYRFTGSAVLASGITAIAGFGVLALSSITMLRDFGLVTLVDLTVSLGGVLLVLPSVLALSERRDALGSVRERLGADRRRAPAAAAGARGVSEPPTPFRALIDNRRYAWMVGVLAAVLVAGFLVYALTHHSSGAGTPGVPAGQPLRYFAAPLAASTLNGDANLEPAVHARRTTIRARSTCACWRVAGRWSWASS